jgi:hypothetical protein
MISASLHVDQSVFSGKFDYNAQCPVCDKKGCSVREGGGVHCTTHRSGNKGETLNGYEFVGEDRSGLGLWRPYVEKGNRQTSTYRLQTTARTLEPVAQIDLAKRDSQLRAWAEESPITGEQRLFLKNRGVSREQVMQAANDEAIFWNIQYGEDGFDSTGLPGNWTEDGKYQGVEGLAIACRQRLEPNGPWHILGAQIRPSKIRDGGGKYLWLSREEASARISQWGELPITVHETTGTTGHLTLCEGTLKPWLIAQRADIHSIDLGVAIVGCAGSAWASTSWTQIEHQCTKVYGVKDIHLALDAGAVQNRNVWGGVRQLAQRCKRAGLTLKIIWYGQLEKTNGDLDELTEVTPYQLLTVNEVEAQFCQPDVIPASALLLKPSPGFVDDYGYLPDHADILLPAISKTRLTAIRANKGTGKTQLIKKLVTQAIERKQRAIIFTHRLALGAAQGALLGLPVKTEVREYGRGEGFVITVDSAHPGSGMRYSADHDLQHDGGGTLVIIDECDQVFDHIAHGKTEIKRHRQAVIDEISETLAGARNVVLLSADITDCHVALTQQAMGITDSLNIVNTTTRKLGNVTVHTNPFSVRFEAEQALERNERILIKVSGQKSDSNHGTSALHAYLKALYPEKKGVIFDGNTLKDPSNPDTFINGINVLQWLSHPDPEERLRRQEEYFAQYDWVIFNNACGTGVSFETPLFHGFYQIETGVGSIRDAAQATARLRPHFYEDAEGNRQPLQRHIYCAPIGLPQLRYGNGATAPNKLAAGEDKAWEKLVSQIQQVGGADWLPSSPLEYSSPRAQAWLGYAINRAAEFNAESLNYAQEFWKQLQVEGYSLGDYNGDWNQIGDSEQKAYKAGCTSARDLLHSKALEQIAAEPMDGADVAKLAQQRELTPKEHRQLKKGRTMERYGLDEETVDVAVLDAEHNGIYHKLMLRYLAEQPKAVAQERDKVTAWHELNEGSPWGRDLAKRAYSPRLALLRELGAIALLESAKNGEKLYSAHPDVLAVAAAALKRRDDVKDILGLTVGVESYNKRTAQMEIKVDRPIVVAQNLFELLGYGLSRIKERVRNEQGKRHWQFELTDSKPAAIDWVKFGEIQEKIMKERAEKVDGSPVNLVLREAKNDPLPTNSENELEPNDDKGFDEKQAGTLTSIDLIETELVGSKNGDTRIPDSGGAAAGADLRVGDRVIYTGEAPNSARSAILRAIMQPLPGVIVYQLSATEDGAAWGARQHEVLLVDTDEPLAIQVMRMMQAVRTPDDWSKLGRQYDAETWQAAWSELIVEDEQKALFIQQMMMAA